MSSHFHRVISLGFHKFVVVFSSKDDFDIVFLKDIAQNESRDSISLPVYFSSNREKIVTRLNVPCGPEKDKWLQCGAALFLKNF